LPEISHLSVTFSPRFYIEIDFTKEQPFIQKQVSEDIASKGL
jgi:hypothetical protein